MISAVTPNFALLIALTVLCSVGSFTTMLVVVVDEEPITMDSVIVDPPFKLAVVDAKAPETLLCSLAIWLTVIEFDPVLALLVVVAENASFWLLLTP